MYIYTQEACKRNRLIVSYLLPCLMMSAFWTSILVLALSFSCLESKILKKLPSAVVVGYVYCDKSCSFKQDLPKSTRSIAGASIAVECINNLKSRRIFRQETKTDKKGEFKVEIPFNVIKRCSVKLISSSEADCGVSSSPTSSSSLSFRGRKEGTHIFSAGIFTFKPGVCDYQRTRNKIIYSDDVEDDDRKRSPVFNPEVPSFLPPIQDPPRIPPAFGYLPPLPRLPPLPSLPRLPPLPGIPFFPPVPMTEKIAANKLLSNQDDQAHLPTTLPFFSNPLQPPNLFPPYPFQPPPSLLPPLVPSPPASVIPPVLPTPGTSPPGSNLPQIPGLINPSPPPPSSQFPFPSFPFQPQPGFPGVPPADVSTSP